MHEKIFTGPGLEPTTNDQMTTTQPTELFILL